MIWLIQPSAINGWQIILILFLIQHLISVINPSFNSYLKIVVMRSTSCPVDCSDAQYIVT